MIIDLQKFVGGERPYWSELERILERVENDQAFVMDLEQLRRFHFLYERASADLAKLAAFSSEGEIHHYLESLITRAYAEIHETREKPHRLVPVRWLFHAFPQTFRRHIRAFWWSLTITILGCALGSAAIAFDPESKEIIMPFRHLSGDPAERVAREERALRDPLTGRKSEFSSFLMTHNTRVSIFTLALGMTWGVGTIIILFYNGVVLGAVCADYLLAEQAKFLAGWLLPHGSIEIPAILIAGQAGLTLGEALIGWGRRLPLRIRLREISPDLMTLIFGVALMLVWAGFVEAFLSQYHEPVIPYSAKIGFGLAELMLLVTFLGKVGKKSDQPPVRS